MNKYVSIWHIIKDRKGKSKAINQHIITDQYIRLNGENTSCREVRRVIRELRQEGYPILSSPHYPNAGYYIPANHQEVEEWQGRMHSKAVALMAIIKPVIKTCQDMFPGKVEQLDLFEEITE